jgi:hypothetical protein
MSQYNLSIHYLKGKENKMADVLSRRKDSDSLDNICTAVMSVQSNPNLQAHIKNVSNLT